jgi:hypothetical protein
MHLVYPTFICKWDIHDLYSYTWPIRAMHDLYKSALALRVLFYFLHSLYVYSSPYLTRDTHYRLIKYITFGVLLCVTYKDHLAIPIVNIKLIKPNIKTKQGDNFNIIGKRYNGFIKLPPLFKIKRLAYKDTINRQ